jgi:hypothetical protein
MVWSEVLLPHSSLLLVNTHAQEDMLLPCNGGLRATNLSHCYALHLGVEAGSQLHHGIDLNKNHISMIKFFRQNLCTIWKADHAHKHTLQDLVGVVRPSHYPSAPALSSGGRVCSKAAPTPLPAPGSKLSCRVLDVSQVRALCLCTRCSTGVMHGLSSRLVKWLLAAGLLYFYSLQVPQRL